MSPEEMQAEIARLENNYAVAAEKEVAALNKVRQLERELARSSALLPCPFCGLTDRDSVAPDAYIPAVMSHNYPGGFRVECEGCGCKGPFHPEHSAAIAGWNSRPNVGDQPRAGSASAPKEKNTL